MCTMSDVLVINLDVLFLGEKREIKPSSYHQPNMKPQSSQYIKHESAHQYNHPQTNPIHRNKQYINHRQAPARVQQLKQPSVEWDEDWSDGEFGEDHVKTEAKTVMGNVNDGRIPSDWSDDDMEFTEEVKDAKTVVNTKSEPRVNTGGGFENWSDDDMCDYVPASPLQVNNTRTKLEERKLISRVANLPQKENCYVSKPANRAKSQEMHWSEDDFDGDDAFESANCPPKPKQQRQTVPAAVTATRTSHQPHQRSSHPESNLNNAQKRQTNIDNFFQPKKPGNSSSVAQQQVVPNISNQKEESNTSLVDLISSDEEDFVIPTQKSKTSVVHKAPAPTMPSKGQSSGSSNGTAGVCSDFHKARFHYISDLQSGFKPDNGRLIVKVRPGLKYLKPSLEGGVYNFLDFHNKQDILINDNKGPKKFRLSYNH